MNIEAIKNDLNILVQHARLAAIPDTQHDVWKAALQRILKELEPKKVDE